MSVIEEKEKRLAELLTIRAEKGRNPEIAREIHELQKQIWAHKHHTFTADTALTIQLFGKKYKDMNVEEKSLYRKLSARQRVPRGGWETSLTRRIFGKRRCDMTPEEISAYHRELAKRKGQ